MEVKTFREYRKKKHEKFLNFEGDFRYLRSKKHGKFLQFDGDFRSIRGKKHEIKEEKYIHEWLKDETPRDDEQSHGFNEHGAAYHRMHDHPDLKPQKLSKTHISSLKRYCSIKSDSKFGHGSSKNINGYLRNRSGADTGVLHHTPEAVHESVKKLSSVFTPENTNKKHMTTYGGVPADIGKKLAKSKEGDEHILPGFTSTSTSKRTAQSFAKNYDISSNEQHVVAYHCHPCTGVSVVHHSSWAENEVLLHHGAKITKMHTETYTGPGGSKNHVHHVTVHHESNPLDEYGKYSETK